jgi:hypothetical protein
VSILTVRLVARGRGVVVVEVAVVVVVRPLLDLLDKRVDERVHLHRLPREDLENLGDALLVLNHAELGRDSPIVKHYS